MSHKDMITEQEVYLDSLMMGEGARRDLEKGIDEE